MFDELELKKKMCYSKKQYSSEKYATKVAKDLSKKRNVELRAYFCPICFLWHITSK